MNMDQHDTSLQRSLGSLTINSSLLYLSLVLLLTTTVYYRVTKRIPSRLRFEQAPKSEFGIIPAGGFGSHAGSGGVEYVSDSPS